MFLVVRTCKTERRLSVRKHSDPQVATKGALGLYPSSWTFKCNYIYQCIIKKESLSLFLPALAQGMLYPHPGPPPLILPLRWRKDRFPASLYQDIRGAGATCEFPEALKGRKAGQHWSQSTWALQPEVFEVWIASALLASFATEVQALSVPQCFCPERGLTNINTCLVGLQGGANGRGDYWTLKKIFFSLKIRV